MDLTRAGVRALAGACALTLLLAACGGDDDDRARSGDDERSERTTEPEEPTSEEEGDDTTTTVIEDETTTDVDEPTTTAVEAPGGAGVEAEIPPGAAGDPEAVGQAQRINLVIDDFDHAWSELPTQGDGSLDVTGCFVQNDIGAATVGVAATGTFATANPGEPGQLVMMQTFVLDSAGTAGSITAEAGGGAFITCVQDVLAGGLGEEASIALSPRPDDPLYAEESFGLVGDVAVTTLAGETLNGVMDLHLFRTGAVVSFVATIDVEVNDIEATVGKLHHVVGLRHIVETR